MPSRPLVGPLFVYLMSAGGLVGAPAPKPGAAPDPDAPIARLGSDRFRAAGGVHALTFSPDGNRLVALAENGMSVWDAGTGRELRFVPWLYAHPRLITWPAKGQPLAVLGPANDGTYLWAFADERARLEPLGDDAPEAYKARFSHVAISGDGSRVAAADAEAKGPVRVWGATAGKRLGELEPLRSIDVGDAGWADFGLTPDAKTLFVFGAKPKAGEVRLTLFDTDTGKERKWLTVASPAAGREGHLKFALSPDGSLLVLARANGTLGLVDLSGADAPQVWGKPNGFEETDRVVAVSPGGKWIAADEFGSVVVSNGINGRRAATLKLAGGLVAAMAFSPDNKRLACATQDGLVEVWDTEKWEELVRPEGHTASIAGVTVGPDGKTAVTAGSDQTMRVWGLPAGAEVRSTKLDRSSNSIHFAPDGKTLLVSVRELGLKGEKWGTRFARVDPTGRSESVAGDLGKGLAEEWPTSTVVGIAADGKTLVTYRRHTVTLWDWPAGTKRRSMEINLPGNWAGELRCRSASLSPDGRLLAVSLEHEENKDFGRVVESAGTCVVDAATGNLEWTLAGPKIWYASVAFTPDGKKLVVAGRGDSKGDDLDEERMSLGLFDAATGKPLRRFQLPEGVEKDRETTAVAVSLDGRAVAVGEADHSITVYELATGRIRQRLVGHRSELKELVPAAGGRLVSAAWDDTFALVWATNPAAAARQAPLAEAALETEWQKLGEPDARSAFRAMVGLAGDPAGTVGCLRKQLRPAKVEDSKANDEEPTAEQLRAVRAVELLESIGGDDARKLLQSLAVGTPAARLTTEAAEALRRLTPR